MASSIAGCGCIFGAFELWTNLVALRGPLAGATARTRYLALPLRTETAPLEVGLLFGLNSTGVAKIVAWYGDRIIQCLGIGG